MMLRTLTALLRRRLWLPLATAVCCGLLVFIGLRAQGKIPRYSATAVVAIGGDVFYGNQDTAYTDLAHSMVANYRHLAEREIVTAAVAAALGLEASPQEIADTLSLSVINDTNLLSIEASYADPETAAAIANEVARQLTTFSPTRSRNFVLLVESARATPAPDVGSLIPVIMTAFAVFLLVIGGVLLVDFGRQPICSEQDVSEWLHLPVLLALHPLPLAAWRYWRGEPALRGETAVWYSLLTICQRLWQAKSKAAAPPRVVLITAPARCASQALVSDRLAQSWTAAGQPALLVALDSLEAYDRPFAAAGVQRLGPEMWPPEATLAQRQDAVEALIRLSERGYTLIVHAPPVSEAVETVMLARRADLVLLVLESVSTPYSLARETLTHFTRNEIAVDGVVLSHWHVGWAPGALMAYRQKRPSPPVGGPVPAPDASSIRERRAM